MSLLIYPNFIRANRRFIDLFLISLTDFRLYCSLCAVKVLLASLRSTMTVLAPRGAEIVIGSRGRQLRSSIALASAGSYADCITSPPRHDRGSALEKCYNPLLSSPTEMPKPLAHKTEEWCAVEVSNL
jgi:hypothetical protein